MQSSHGERLRIARHRYARRGASAWMLVGGLAVLSALAIAAGAYYKFSGDGDGIQPVVHTVERGSFAFDVVERGEIESSDNIEIRCAVKSQGGSGTAIIEVVAPEGSMVEKGDVLMRLDSSGLEQDLLQQEIILATSEAAVIQATNARDAALISKIEYEEGAYRQEEQTILSEIFVAEENLRRAEQYVLHSERLAARGYVTALQLEGDRFAVSKAQNELEAGQTKLHVLQEYTLQKNLKELESAIISGEAALKAETSSYAIEEQKYAEIQQQIAACTIVASQAGQVVHANESDRRGNSEVVMEPGTLVRERQVLVRLPNPDRMQVKAEISETRIAYIEPGMSVDVQVDAFNGMVLRGVVEKVNEYPEAGGWFSSSVKKYVTLVAIQSPPTTLRPGLTAQVRIHVEELEDVLSVPAQAILERSGWYYCLVKEGEEWKPRRVMIGPTNEKLVVVEDGLEEGDQVALNPRRYLDEDKLEGGPAHTAPQAEGEPGAPDAGPSGPRERGGSREGGGPGAQGAAGGRPQQAGAPGGQGPPGGFDPSAIFTRMGANSDGKLTADEMPEDRREQFMQGDTNGDGAISLAEMQAAFAAMRAAGGGGPPGGPPSQ